MPHEDMTAGTATRRGATAARRSASAGRSRIWGRKALAILAGCAVVGIGTAGTLAAWNDNEWVAAVVNGDQAGLRSSTFAVWQNRDQAPTAESAWTDHASNPDAGGLEFSLGALALTPGDSVYAPVAIQSKADSVAGTLTLQSPEASNDVTAEDTDGLLWAALRYSVKATTTPTQCDASTWDAFGATVVTDAALTAPLTAASQSVAADRGDIQYYCFEVTLPGYVDEANPTPAELDALNPLQGRSVAPAWRFAAESVS
ncbi:MAG TPA: SipW-dependent-type signal peptide-containing protein [Microbacterium sp.]|nr:SipW-dependent-type signal peptide-containing protein [Microbacterium sp.]